MDRHQFSKIRHSSLNLCSPLLERDVLDMARLIDIAADASLLELGCGKGEVLALACQALGAKGLGVDLPGSLAEELSPLAEKLKSNGVLEFKYQDAADFLSQNQLKYDVVISVGASQAIGGFSNLAATTRKLLKPKGWLLLGELVWRAAPRPELLEALGMTEGSLPWFREVQSHLESFGFETAEWCSVTRQQFLQYEQTLLENGRAHASARAQSESWFELVNQFGLEAFSFGYGVFRS